MLSNHLSAKSLKVQSTIINLLIHILFNANFIILDEPFQPSTNEPEPISGPTFQFNTFPSGHQDPELILSVKRLQENPAQLIHVKPIKPELM